MAATTRRPGNVTAPSRRSSWEALPTGRSARGARPGLRTGTATAATSASGTRIAAISEIPAETSASGTRIAAISEIPAETSAPQEPSTGSRAARRHRATPRISGLVAALPAHNEEAGIAAAIRGLQNQTCPPDHIVVIADNCTDRTVEIARANGAEVFETTDNTHKKAGALNQFLAEILPQLREDDLVLVQDADSALDPDFLQIARKNLKGSIGAVGGVFRGSEGGGFVGHLQRNEYARYARDVRRLGGKCLVVTGTAAVLQVGLLRRISQARLAGELPAGDGRGGIYDTSVLTEDNELTFAIRHLGYDVLSPAGCTLVTEIMPTWGELWRQRLRWKRGAVENCVQYGFTRITRPYWGRQVLTMIGCLITYIYLATIVYAVATNNLSIQPFWMAVTVIFIVERIVTVRDRGWRHMVLAGLMYELIIDLFLQLVHTKAYLDALTNRRRDW